MSAIFQRMAKALPERHAPGKSSFATESKALREWIDHLPLANPAATSFAIVEQPYEPEAMAPLSEKDKELP